MAELLFLATGGGLVLARREKPGEPDWREAGRSSDGRDVMAGEVPVGVAPIWAVGLLPLGEHQSVAGSQKQLFRHTLPPLTTPRYTSIILLFYKVLH